MINAKKRGNKSTSKQEADDLFAAKMQKQLRYVGLKKKDSLLTDTSLNCKSTKKSTSQSNIMVRTPTYKRPNMKRKSIKQQVVPQEVISSLKSACFSLKSVTCKLECQDWLENEDIKRLLKEIKIEVEKLESTKKHSVNLKLNLETIGNRNFNQEFMEMYEGFSESWRKEADKMNKN